LAEYLNSKVARNAQPFHRSGRVANGNVEIKVKLVVGFFIATCFVDAHWNRLEIQIKKSTPSSAMPTAVT
jgi:hypothetical protein